ncbi:vWA domain-containing protein [Bacillus sp. EB01]|uniref:vWA domain-containing protein n=1 Tax=Bacillus sp. EB01 TaxID=1347086 RepID=UPI0005C54310|nr:vWA domain-containing protein [Bacillus sp. EB01]
MNKNFFSLLVSLLLFVGILAQPAAADTSKSRIEGVLVVDVSRSMLESDPGKISNEAMKMFIDMSSLKGDKIGVLAYTDEIIREKSLVRIRSEQDKKTLKEFIDSVGRYPFTDISVGVKEAVNVLDMGHEDGYAPLIVLLADGNNDLDENKPRTAKQADADLKKAVDAAHDKGYPVYTIGLNADGTLNKSVLQNIAKSTGGKYFETKSADSLPGILSEIFANHLKLKIVPVDQFTANGAFQDIKINVPNENVLEANISIMSSKPVEVKLADPSGKEVKIPSDAVLLSKSKSYSMLKLIRPAAGDWTLSVKGVKKDKIDINLVFNYDLQLKLSASGGNTHKTGDTVKFESFFEDGGDRVEGKEFYQTMNAVLQVKNVGTGKTEEVPLSAGDSSFSGEFKIPADGDYEIIAMAEDSSFTKESEPLKLSTAKSATAPAATKPAQPEEPFPWMTVLLGVLGAVVLIGLALFLLSKVKQANRGFSGQMVVEVKDEDTGERTSPQYRKLNAFKGRFKLHQLLSLAPEFAETNTIQLKPGPGDSLVLINSSSAMIEKGGRAIDASKGLTIKKNDRLRIVLKQVNKSVYIEYIS